MPSLARVWRAAPAVDFVALRSERHGTLWRVLEGVFSKRDHEFESGFLQRRVMSEP
jgi:hypothetical protein